MNEPHVILTRAESDNRRVAPFFKERGMEVLSIPLIEISDLPISPWEIPPFSTPPLVLLTSSRATMRWLALYQQLADREIYGYLVVGQSSAEQLRESDPETPILIVNDSTEELLEDIINLRHAQFEHVGTGSAETTTAFSEGNNISTILYPCSTRRREESITGFKSLGYTLLEIPLYEPICPPESATALAEKLSDISPSTFITFFSPSAVEHFFEILLSQDPTGMLLLNATKRLTFAAIGETTADALYEQGIEEVIVPARPDAELLAEEIAQYGSEG